jgi:hypothetical protein
VEEITEHIPCGPASKEVYTSMDWVDRYMTDADTLSDIGLVGTSKVLDIVAHKGYHMVHVIEQSVLAQSLKASRPRLA